MAAEHLSKRHADIHERVPIPRVRLVSTYSRASRISMTSCMYPEGWSIQACITGRWLRRSDWLYGASSRCQITRVLSQGPLQSGLTLKLEESVYDGSTDGILVEADLGLQCSAIHNVELVALTLVPTKCRSYFSSMNSLGRG